MSESSNSGTPLHDFCTNALVGLELLNQLEEKGFILSSTSEQIVSNFSTRSKMSKYMIRICTFFF